MLIDFLVAMVDQVVAVGRISGDTWTLKPTESLPLTREDVESQDLQQNSGYMSI